MVQKPKAINRSYNQKKKLAPYIMVFPAIAFLLVFTVYPMCELVHLSFWRGNAMLPYKEYMGFGNYVKLFGKQDFLGALRNTAIYTVSVVVLLISFSVIFAVWVEKNRRINHLAQTIFFTPHLIAGISCAFIWTWLFNSENYGLFNSVIRFFGGTSVRWLDDSRTALGCVITMNVWKSIGYYALIILSALKSIPAEIYESANLDGAGTVATFFKITLPMLTPQLFMLLITITTSAFKVFESVRIMTGGGPGRSTTTLTMFVYDYAFQRNNQLGTGAAAGVVLMIILILITLLDFRSLERKVHYQ